LIAPNQRPYSPRPDEPDCSSFIQALFTTVPSAWMLIADTTTYVGPWLGASAQGSTWSWVDSQPWS
jgi:hypothetical protein